MSDSPDDDALQPTESPSTATGVPTPADDDATTMAVQARRIAIERDATRRSQADLASEVDFQAGGSSEEQVNAAKASLKELVRAVNSTDLVLLYWNLGRNDKAEPLLRGTLEGAKRALGSNHPATLHVMGNLGSDLVTLERAEQAEPLLAEDVVRPDHPEIEKVTSDLIALYDAWSKPPKTAELRAVLPGRSGR